MLDYLVRLLTNLVIIHFSYLSWQASESYFTALMALVFLIAFSVFILSVLF